MSAELLIAVFYNSLLLFIFMMKECAVFKSDIFWNRKIRLSDKNK